MDPQHFGPVYDCLFDELLIYSEDKKKGAGNVR